MSAKVFTESSPIGKRVLRAAALSAQIDRLQAELGEEKAYLLSYATRQGIPGMKANGFTFSRRMKTSWLFSDAVKALSKRLKALQEKEKDNGTAVKVEGAEHLVLTVSIGAVAESLPAPADVAANLNILLQKTPSRSAAATGEAAHV
jgi:hypothetical protein